MPYFIDGWIEATRFEGAEQEDRYAWQAIVNISALVDTADVVSERLFGLSKDWRPEHGAAAADRGVPPNPSETVRAELAEIQRLDRHSNEPSFGGFTYATWREVKDALAGVDVSGSDWRIVFDLARRLEEDERLSDEKIRFVVWYDW